MAIPLSLVYCKKSCAFIFVVVFTVLYKHLFTKKPDCTVSKIDIGL